jgi:hypothetical protein
MGQRNKWKEFMIKTFYVWLVRGLRFIANKTGILKMLDLKKNNTLFLYVRSLFSIWDIHDMAKLDIPWWTCGAITSVESFLKGLDGKARVFEYGPGASTLWLSKRVKYISYVEHDDEFFNLLSELLADKRNVKGALIPPQFNQGSPTAFSSGRRGFEKLDFSEYVNSIRAAEGPFNLIVIDGRARVACLREAIKHLAPNGMILFDNSNRKRYRAGIDSSGMNEKSFRGLAPCLPYIENTSLLTAK